MQVADEREVINMLDGDALDRIVAKHNPDLIVPEIEAIRTERFYDYEKQGKQVVPSARAANFTMNRKAIRDLAAEKQFAILLQKNWDYAQRNMLMLHPKTNYAMRYNPSDFLA